MEQKNDAPTSSRKAMNRVSKSGRQTKTPKAILTRSSDEAPPPRRSSKAAVSVKNESQPLRNIAKNITASKKRSSAETLNRIHAEISKKTSDEVSETVPIRSRKSISANVIETSLPKRRCLSRLLSEENNEDDTDGSGPVNESSEQHSKIELKQVLENLRVIQLQNAIIQQQNTDIQQQNDKIMQQLELMSDELKQNNAVEEISANLYERLEGFPLKTVDEFKKIETEGGKNQRKKLYHHLCNLGGSKVREFLSCALKETMTDELVNKFSWPGGPHSQKLGDTKIANVLYLAAKNCPLFRGPDTKTEFKTELQEVLRATKQRFRKLLKKSLQPEEPQDQTESTVEDESGILDRIRQLKEELNNQSFEDQIFQEEMNIAEADVDTDNY